MEHVPTARLAELPATKWEQAKVRVAVVRRYIREGDTSLGAVARHAAEIGIGRGMFARLVATVRAWDESRQPARPTPHRRPNDPAQAAAASEAVARAGPGATLEEAIQMAIRIAAETGGRTPTERAISRAHGRIRAGQAIRERLRLTECFALDSTALAARVVLAEGATAVAVLTGVVDLQDGSFAAWRVTAGLPEGREIDGIVREVLDAAGEHRSFAVTSSLPDAAPAIMAERGIEMLDRKLEGGSVLRAALGAKIGRISLLPRLLVRGGEPTLPHVSLEDLASVLAELLRPA